MPAACPYCEWSDHAYRLPAHILSRHIEHIRIGAVPRDHCLNAFVRPDDGLGLLEFSVCLTCKKGTVADITEGNGQRWVSLHSKKDACRAAHAAAYAAFKTTWETAKAQALPPQPPPPPAEDPSGTSIASLWEECKSNKTLAPMVAIIESRVLEISEGYDDDPCFTPEEGFKQAIYSAVGYYNDVESEKEKMNKLVIAHDGEIRNLHGVIREQVASMKCLEGMVKDQCYQIAQLRADNEQIQAELEAIQDENNALRKETAERSAEIGLLQESNTLLHAEVGGLKDEMTVLREQMAAMQKEFDAYKKAHPV